MQTHTNLEFISVVRAGRHGIALPKLLQGSPSTGNVEFSPSCSLRKTAKIKKIKIFRGHTNMYRPATPPHIATAPVTNMPLKRKRRRGRCFRMPLLRSVNGSLATHQRANTAKAPLVCRQSDWVTGETKTVDLFYEGSY